jgi:glucose/arabinose dehydrogenase
MPDTQWQFRYYRLLKSRSEAKIMTKTFTTLSMFFLLIFPIITFANTIITHSSAGTQYQVNIISNELNIPWAMAFLNQKQLLITERQGTLKLLDRFSGHIKAINGLPPIYNKGQGGLLDVAIPSDYTKSDWVYFTYSKPVKNSGATTLARAKLEAGKLTHWTDLLVTQSVTDTNRHFGSRIAFDDKGHIFFTVGDRGIRPNGQDLTTHSGSVLRLNLDGSIPKDNPFFKRTNALPEIWSYGHRNPQGLSYDFQLKRLWLIEHGPRGGDEINLIRKGKNYGWPLVSYGKEYWGPISVGDATERVGFESPTKYYVPSIAPGSLLLYTGTAFPNWKGNLFAGALKLQHLNRVTLNKASAAVGEERLLEDMNERIRSLVQSPEGWIYLSTDSGKIMSLMPISQH